MGAALYLVLYDIFRNKGPNLIESVSDVLREMGNETNRHRSRGMSGYRARRRVADSRGPVLVAGLSPNK
jgi:hypothetical protein